MSRFSRIDLSEISFEKRISRRKNTPHHITARNAFFRRPRSMYVSSDKRKPWRFATVSSCSAGLDFKPSRRVIVIVLNLEDRVVPRLPSSVSHRERRSPFFFLVVWEASQTAPGIDREQLLQLPVVTTMCRRSGKRDDKKEKRGGK